jgi:hypothetical protein
MLKKANGRGQTSLSPLAKASLAAKNGSGQSGLSPSIRLFQHPRREKGHAMLELAMCASVLVACLGGTFQFGYTFYVYNQLVTAVGNGARYASGHTYRAATPKDIEKGDEAIRNMVVYGDPHPSAGAIPVVPDLKRDEVEVKWIFSNEKTGAPEFVDVSIAGHRVNALLGSFNFSGRPRVEFPYLGRYAPAESER